MSPAHHHYVAGLMIRPIRPGDDMMAARVLDVLDGLRRLNAADLEWLRELHADAPDAVHRRWCELLLDEVAEKAGDL